MPRYTVYLKTIAEVALRIEAESREEAVEMAAEAEMPTICGHCSGWGRDYILELGEAWEETGEVTDADGNTVPAATEGDSGA